MPRRVQPGDRFQVTAAEYNRILAAADEIARDRLAGGQRNRHYVRDVATVRVHNQSANTIPIGGVVGITAPLGDADLGPADLARFVRHTTLQVVEPNSQEHTGRFGIAIEPLGPNQLGRAVFDGIAAAKVNIQETWHNHADIADGTGSYLQSKPQGAAQILWRRFPNALGLQWAIVRLGNREATSILTAQLLSDLYSTHTLASVVPLDNSHASQSFAQVWNPYKLAGNAGDLVALYWEDAPLIKAWSIVQVTHRPQYIVESLQLQSSSYEADSKYGSSCQTLTAQRRKIQAVYCENESQLEPYVVGQVCGCSSYDAQSGSESDMMLIEMPE